jgi:hypothetical protein
MGPLLLLLIIAIPICGLIGYYIQTKNHERIKLIENGLDPNNGLNVKEYHKQTNLKNGILFISLAFGLFFGHLLVICFVNLDSFITYLSMLLLFGGIGFLINFFILRNWNSK